MFRQKNEQEMKKTLTGRFDGLLSLNEEKQ